jgi:hypothetical protein
MLRNLFVLIAVLLFFGGFFMSVYRFVISDYYGAYVSSYRKDELFYLVALIVGGYILTKISKDEDEDFTEDPTITQENKKTRKK